MYTGRTRDTLFECFACRSNHKLDANENKQQNVLGDLASFSKYLLLGPPPPSSWKYNKMIMHARYTTPLKLIVCSYNRLYNQRTTLKSVRKTILLLKKESDSRSAHDHNNLFGNTIMILAVTQDRILYLPFRQQSITKYLKTNLQDELTRRLYKAHDSLTMGSSEMPDTATIHARRKNEEHFLENHLN